MHGLIVFAAETAEVVGHEEEGSKTAFYILGSLLAVYAVVISFIGMKARAFPSSKSARGGIMAVSAVLVVAALAASIATS